MKAPDALLEHLMARVRGDLYKGKPERVWFTQQVRVKAALTLPAAWLDERKVEISAERYQAILESILHTIKAHGRSPKQLGPFPCAYLHSCVEKHLAHHGDEYYEEGKAIRNRVTIFMGRVEKARIGADSTVPVLSATHAALDVGKRKAKGKAVATSQQPDLF
jgi:hypothetical protein